MNLKQLKLILNFPVSAKLSMKLLSKSAGVKKAAMAAQLDVERATGYVLGGVSPLGQKNRLKTFIDSSAKSFSTIFVSAGRRGVEIALDPVDLNALVSGVFTELAL